MASLNDTNLTDSYDQAINILAGATDNTKIGNVGDSLKTTATVTFPTGQVIAWNKYLTYYDMDASNGGVARDASIGTTFTNVFSYTGKGFLIGFRLSLEDKSKWFIRLTVDSIDVFMGSTGISTEDMSSKNIYGWEWGDNFDESTIGLDCNDETICFQSPLAYPIYFTTSCVLQVKHATSNKKFRAGILALQRDL